MTRKESEIRDREIVIHLSLGIGPPRSALLLPNTSRPVNAANEPRPAEMAVGILGRGAMACVLGLRFVRGTAFLLLVLLVAQVVREIGDHGGFVCGVHLLDLPSPSLGLSTPSSRLDRRASIEVLPAPV